MEAQGQPILHTLAQKLGDIPHVSGLAFRLAHASGAAGHLPRWLMKVAVERGATHYSRNFDPCLPPDDPDLPDEEIGIGLCLGQNPYELDHLRAAAQLLSSRRVNPSVGLSGPSTDEQRSQRAKASQESVFYPAAGVVTHLFRELEIVLTPNWLETRVSVPLGLTHLNTMRPSTLDLVLTKMMRGDSNDLADIDFLILQESLSPTLLKQAFARARLPETPEIQDLFRAAQPMVMEIALRIERKTIHHSTSSAPPQTH